MSNEIKKENSLRKAELKHPLWPNAIWALPVIATLAVVWIMLRAFFFSGAEITVTFPTGHGLAAKGTPVRYSGVQIGSVDEIRLSEDLRQVIVSISIESVQDSFTRDGARFWISQPALSLSAPTDLLTGAFIEASPGSGKRKTRFDGLDSPPILLPEGKGTLLRLSVAEGENGMNPVQSDAPVVHRGQPVGRVLGRELGEDLTSTVVLFIEAPYDKAIGDRTVFWRGGGLSATGGLDPLRLDISSLKTLLSDWIHFDELEEGIPAPSAEVPKKLFSSLQDAQRAPVGKQVLFMTFFSADGQAPEPDASVTLGDRFIGRVQSRKLVYDPEQMRFVHKTVLSLDEGRLSFEQAPFDPSKSLREKISILVGMGLRAEAKRDAIIFGETSVSLVLRTGKGTVDFDTLGELPVIPSFGTQGDLSSLIARASGVLRNFEEIPIDAISRDIRETTQAIRSLVSDPRAERTLRNLDATMASLDRIVSDTEAGLPEIMGSLQSAANSVETVASTILDITGGRQAGDSDMTDLVSEMTQAAEAIRRLASTLSRKPESLIRGR